MRALRVLKFFFFGLMTLAVLGLSACGGGGGSSSGSSGSSAGTISGVAATGKAIADATVTLIDSKGKTATGTTNGNGVFTINTSGLTPPFLLAVKSNAGSTSGMYLYSVSDSASPATINITPLTDMIIRAWYQMQGTNAAAAAGALINGTLGGSNAPPTPVEAGTIADTVKNILKDVLVNAGIGNASSFDPISGAITAGSGSGYDGALDNITGYNQGSSGLTIVLNDGNNISTTIMVTPGSDGTANESTYSSDGTATTGTLSMADYSASGIYTYDSGTNTFTMSTTSSTFPCNGPEAGESESLTVSNLTSTTMRWTKSSDVFNWTSSSATGVVGTWRMTDPSNGGQYTATINANGTWSVTGTATSCGSSTGSSGTFSSASANGTYNFDTGNNSLIINTTSSNFPCDGPPVGLLTFAVSNATSESMTWTASGNGSENIMNWTRISGSGSGMEGIWTSTNRRGDSFTATINADKTWSVLGNINSTSCESDTGNFDTAACKGDSTSAIINGTGMGSFSTTFGNNGVTQTCYLPVTIMQDGASVIFTGGSCTGAGGTYSGNGPITGTWTGCLSGSTLNLSITYYDGSTESMTCSVSGNSISGCTVGGKVPTPSGDSTLSGTGGVTPSGSGM